MLNNLQIRVLILAGGKGTRLAPLIPDLPKPMAPVGDRPFLAHLIETLHSQGLNRISLLTGHKAESLW